MRRLNLILAAMIVLVGGAGLWLDYRQPPVYGKHPPLGISYGDMLALENGKNLDYWHRMADRPWIPQPRRVMARYLISYMTRETGDWPKLVTVSYRKDHVADDKLQFASSPYPNAFRLMGETDIKPGVKHYKLYATYRTSVPDDTSYQEWMIELRKQSGRWLVNDLK